MPIYNSPNMAALQASILAAITTSKDEVKARVDLKASDVAATVNNNTNTKATEIKADVAAKSAIKSIQRGTATMPAANTLTVNISAVNLSKSTVQISFSNNSSINDNTNIPRASLKTTTTFELKTGAAVNTIVDWEVIEYV